MFKFENPHPQGKKVGDCVKRAIVIATGINYHDVEVMLNRYKKVSGGKFYNSNDNWKPFIENILMGEKYSVDMQHDFHGHRYTVRDWCDNHYKTTILRCSKHLVATKDGDYFDIWDSGDKGVYIAYFIPSYKLIVNNLRLHHPELCKGLTLEKRSFVL